MEAVPTLYGEADGADVPSWVSVCPRGLWRVQQKHKWSQQTVSDSGNITSCLSKTCPSLGSLCRVRVQLQVQKDDTDRSLVFGDVTELAVTPFLRCQDSVLQIPVGDWITLRLGEGQCDVTEACLEGMRAGEKCEIQLTPLGNEADASVHQPSDGNLPLCATVELQAFTPGKESWEMPADEKVEWVKSHKERGGVRFRGGDVWGAADSYSRALKLLIPLCGLVGAMEPKAQELESGEESDTSPSEEALQLPSRDELKIIKAELHSNLSLCQLKLNQPERAKASAAKATKLEPGASKAWYRLGQACQMLNELEEAKQAFRKLLELQPDLPAAVKALKDVIHKEKQRNAQLGQRLSKMFT
ncbi:FK506-binding protein-like [Kryptolebias marmoratus]|uniref:FK506-binding protein-like n=1 Tax=Kryptolebias marmoratus TaxID=37003 RepID=UPI0007F8C385|nr:FK506-binding protein-like [Kryptolebias marmoratus]XP_024861465.1 FK506-binding protein-like [Kryptolebias marmoratus]XP_037833087.1 FK506-binding protein-like [Kryptolebias marmoratus]